MQAGGKGFAMENEAQVQGRNAAGASGDTHVMTGGGRPQSEINREEWENPLNWGGPQNLAVYFSKKDTRIWVPQHKPSSGWTVNLAHTGGIVWMVGICMGMIIILMALSGWVFSDVLIRLLSQ